MDVLVKKYQELNIAVKASLWFIFCNLILKGIGFITVPIFSRLLPPSEYGTLSVFMAFEQIILTLSTWETALSAYQRGIFKYKENIRFFTKSTLVFSNIITTLFFAVIFILYPQFNSFTGLSLQNTIWLYVYMIVQPAYSCWLVEMRTYYEYRKATFTTILYGVVSVVVPMSAILLINSNADIKFKFTLIGSIAVYLFFYLRDYSFKSLKSHRSLVKEQWKFIVSYQLPIVAHALSFTILSQADRIMIDKMVGASEAAFYSVAYNIAMIISIIQSSINQALVPWRFEKLENKNYSSIKKTTAPLLVAIGFLVLIFIFIAPEIIRVLFMEDYYEAIWCIPPVSLSVYFMFLYSLFVWVENYYEKTKYVAFVSFFSALLNIILNYLLIDIFGYIVCGYTTLFSYIIFCFGHYFFMKKTLKECEINGQIYDIRACVLISVILTLGMIVAVLTYSYIVLRYLIIILIFVFMLINQRKINNLLSYFKNN